MQIYQTNMGLHCRLDWIASHQAIKLEAKRHCHAMVDKHDDNTRCAKEGCVSSSHACYVGDLEREEC